MKKNYLFIRTTILVWMGISSYVVFAQDVMSSYPSNGKVFEKVEDMPCFPGGVDALKSFLAENLKYPVVAEENGIQGKVVASFVVSKDGTITNPQIVKSVDPSLDKEALRLIRMMPKWTPGREKGKAVNVKYTIPFTFKLNNGSGQVSQQKNKSRFVDLVKHYKPDGYPLVFIEKKGVNVREEPSLKAKKAMSRWGIVHIDGPVILKSVKQKNGFFYFDDLEDGFARGWVSGTICRLAKNTPVSPKYYNRWFRYVNNSIARVAFNNQLGLYLAEVVNDGDVESGEGGYHLLYLGRDENGICNLCCVVDVEIYQDDNGPKDRLDVKKEKGTKTDWDESPVPVFKITFGKGYACENQYGILDLTKLPSEFVMSIFSEKIEKELESQKKAAESGYGIQDLELYGGDYINEELVEITIM